MDSVLQKNSLSQWRLRGADAAMRNFITAFLLLLSTGYIVGILFVDHRTQGTSRGLIEEYRGTPEVSRAAELKYAKSVDEMYIFLHNHILSLSVVFFAVGGIFYFSSLTSPGVKHFLIVEPFAAIATTFGGIWLMRFVAPQFSWLVLISGISMVGCYAIMVFLILWELWKRNS